MRWRRCDLMLPCQGRRASRLASACSHSAHSCFMHAVGVWWRRARLRYCRSSMHMAAAHIGSWPADAQRHAPAPPGMLDKCRPSPSHGLGPGCTDSRRRRRCRPDRCRSEESPNRNQDRQKAHRREHPEAPEGPQDAPMMLAGAPELGGTQEALKTLPGGFQPRSPQWPPEDG